MLVCAQDGLVCRPKNSWRSRSHASPLINYPPAAIEWEEWGNPSDPVYYEYMKSYSPVDNIHAADYPHILVTAGLHDPRVGAWGGKEAED